MPFTRIIPLVGFRIPLRIFRVVLFPDPFGPTIPRASPRPTRKDTSCSAQNSFPLKPVFTFFPKVFLKIPGRRSRRESYPSPRRNFL